MKKIDELYNYFGDWLKKRITPKSIAIAFLTIFFISIIPILLLGKYTVPSADDFTFGSRCRFVWLETHSVFQTLKQAFLAAILYYKIWAGCISSSIFMVLQPGIFGIYGITPILMIGILSVGTYLFLYVGFVKIMGCDFWCVFSIASLLLFTTIQCTPGPEQAFLWYNGASHYTLIYGITLCFYSSILMVLWNNLQKKKIIWMICATLLGLIVAGGNYLTALNAAILLFILVIGLFLLGKRKEIIFVLLPMVVFYIMFILNIIAPGNKIRQETAAGGMAPLKAVLVSFFYVFDYCLSQWTNWMEMVLIIFTILISWHMVKKLQFKFQCPLLVVGFSMALEAAMMTPSLYGTGNIAAGRISAVIYMYYLMLLVLNIFYLTGWIQKKILVGLSWKNNQSDNGFSKDLCITMVSLGMVLFIGIGLTAIPSPERITSIEACRELYSGEAIDFYEQHLERNRIYTSGEKNVIVKELSVHPPLLFISDIKPDSNDWENIGLCRYYDLETVKSVKNQ